MTVAFREDRRARACRRLLVLFLVVSAACALLIALSGTSALASISVPDSAADTTALSLGHSDDRSSPNQLERTIDSLPPPASIESAAERSQAGELPGVVAGTIRTNGETTELPSGALPALGNWGFTLMIVWLIGLGLFVGQRRMRGD